MKAQCSLLNVTLNDSTSIVPTHALTTQVTRRRLCFRSVILWIALCGVTVTSSHPALAHYRRHRQYYGDWSYNPIQTYYYRSYYYLPYTAATTYSYHYVVCYPSQPQYYYYYNPVQSYYWGRYDVKAKGYSLLAEKDRKSRLEEIPESAFPKPGKMPHIPEAKDDVAMEVAPQDVPRDVPKNSAAVPVGDVSSK